MKYKMNTTLFVTVMLVLDIVSGRYGRHDFFQATSNDAEDTYHDDEPEHTQDYMKSKPMINNDIIQQLKMFKKYQDLSVFNRMFGRMSGLPIWGQMLYLWALKL